MGLLRKELFDKKNDVFIFNFGFRFHSKSFVAENYDRLNFNPN